MSALPKILRDTGLDQVTLDDVRTELAERSLSQFIRQAWHVLEPNTPYRHGWHVDAIAEHLEAVSAGEIQNLVINVPPGYMKSLETSVFWPAWAWGPNAEPHLRWITASYSGELSTRDNNKMRALIASPWYQARWGARFRVTKDNEGRVENDKTGLRIASSVGGLGTGERVHRAVHDDLLRANDTHSAAMRKQAEDHLRAMSTRGVSPEEYRQVLIMQRLHEKDPTGYVLQQGGWEHLCLPAEYESKRTVYVNGVKKTVDVKRTPTVIGWTDPRKTEGEPLWPGMYPRAEIAKLKASLGSFGAAGQLQQRPAPADGGVVLRKWWQYYQELPARFDHVIDSWDMAFKDTAASAYVVGQKWGAVGADRYLIKQVRAKMDFVKSLAAVKLLRTPSTEAILIEDKANGPAVIASLKASVGGVVAIEPDGGKEARAHAQSPLVEAGNVYLPDPSIEPWVEDFIDEWCAVPNGEYWDQVDASTQALGYMRRYDNDGLGVAPVSMTGTSHWR
jgi:predicted phage terminase large subunit-like protein